MVISRPIENTPSVVNEQLGSYSMHWYSFDTLEEECNFIVTQIINDIQKEELLPDDICVICVDQRYISKYYDMISSELHTKGIRSFNMLTAPNANRRFTYSDMVTLATLNKAKGNEAGMVYIAGADALFKNPDNVLARNKLFTAITRAKGWVTICGTGKDAMMVCDKELQQLIKNEYKLIFKLPSETQTKTVMAGSMKQQDTINEIISRIEELNKTGLSIDEVLSIIKKK